MFAAPGAQLGSQERRNAPLFLKNRRRSVETSRRDASGAEIERDSPPNEKMVASARKVTRGGLNVVSFFISPNFDQVVFARIHASRAVLK